MSHEIEEGIELKLDYKKLASIGSLGLDVVPVVVQEATTKDILILAYANQEALEHSLSTKKATFWSTSRNELWIKGDTSGDILQIVDILVNCEQNSLLYLVHSTTGSSCHTKDQNNKARSNCYYRKITNTSNLEFIAT